jgi:hypothetical protein
MNSRALSRKLGCGDLHAVDVGLEAAAESAEQEHPEARALVTSPSPSRKTEQGRTADKPGARACHKLTSRWSISARAYYSQALCRFRSDAFERRGFRNRCAGGDRLSPRCRGLTTQRIERVAGSLSSNAPGVSSWDDSGFISKDSWRRSFQRKSRTPHPSPNNEALRLGTITKSLPLAL